MRNHILLLLAFGFTLSSAFGQTDEEIAAAKWPNFAFATQFTSLSPHKEWQTLRVPLDSSKPAMLVIAYCDGFEAMTRVLNTSSGTAVIVAESEAVTGSQAPQLEAADIDGDGVPEILMSTDIGRGHRYGWVYRWTGSSLICLNGDSDVVDTATGKAMPTPLRSPSLLDVDGDGRLDLIVASERFGLPADPSDPDSALDQSYYRMGLSGTRLVRDPETLNFFGLFVRGAGAPKVASRSFAAAPGPYTLRIVTGGDSKNVASAIISLNGVPIFIPSDFSSNTAVLTRDVSLPTSQNVISVELRSAPATRLQLSLHAR